MSVCTSMLHSSSLKNSVQYLKKGFYVAQKLSMASQKKYKISGVSSWHKTDFLLQFYKYSEVAISIILWILYTQLNFLILSSFGYEI